MMKKIGWMLFGCGCIGFLIGGAGLDGPDLVPSAAITVGSFLAAAVGYRWSGFGEKEGDEMNEIHTYKVIKEDFHTGQRGKRARVIVRNRPLKVNGLYAHLGNGMKGCYRVLEEIIVHRNCERMKKP